MYRFRLYIMLTMGIISLWLFSCINKQENNTDAVTLENSLPSAKKSKYLKEDIGFYVLTSQNSKVSTINERQEKDQIVEVTLQRKGFFSASFRKHFVYRIKLENKSDKDIRSVIGILQIKLPADKVAPGDQIKSVLINYEKGIAAHSTVGERINVNYNELDGRDQLLKTLDVEDINTEWITERIIFIDGSMLQVAN